MIREHSRPYSEPQKSTVFKNLLLFTVIFLLMVFIGYLMVYWGTLIER